MSISANSTSVNAEPGLGTGVNIPLTRLIWAAPLAILFAAVAAYGGYHFPNKPFVVLASLAIYAGVLWWRPQLWLFFVPALLPLLNLVPWSGRFFFDEMDLVLLVTLAVCVLRSGRSRTPALAPLAAPLIFAFVMVFLVSVVIGLLPLEPLDSNAFASYYSHYNALRVGKSLAWGIALVRLLRTTLAYDATALSHYWLPGMLAGLAGVVAVALWERVAFPGLTNFSTEYRITATFGSMHVGGGAIDGYLALALPFTLAWIREVKSPLKVFAGGVLFSLATYAIIATFSRGLYLAYGVMIAVFAFGSIVRLRTTGEFSVLRAFFSALIIFLLCVLAFRVFATGGYRTLAAVLGVWGIAFFLGRRAESRGGIFLAVMLAVPVLAMNLALIKLLAKGPYLAYGLAWLIGAAGVSSMILRERTTKQRLAWLGFLTAAVTAPFVGLKWGGQPALWATIPAIVSVVLLVIVNRIVRQPLWQANLKHGSVVGFVALIFFLAIPIAGNSYFMTSRLEGRSSDLNVRVAHWNDALNMIEEKPMARMFGMGVGRFPVTFFWHSHRATTPGTFQIGHDISGQYLRLGGARYGFGGATVYFTQSVSVKPFQQLKVKFDARTTFPKVSIDVGLCEMLHIYSENCETKTVNLAKSDGTWQTMEVSLTTRVLGAWHAYGKKPVKFWLVSPPASTNVDIDNVRLLDETGNNLVANGDFSAGADHWLFSVSDYWPWHIESIWIHLLFEQGWLGLTLLIMLILYAVCRLLMLISQGHSLALMILVALAGFVSVGTLNSLFEFPRVALLFYVLLFMSFVRWPQTVAPITRPEPPTTRPHSRTSRSRGAA